MASLFHCRSYLSIQISICRIPLFFSPFIQFFFHLSWLSYKINLLISINISVDFYPDINCFHFNEISRDSIRAYLFMALHKKEWAWTLWSSANPIFQGAQRIEHFIYMDSVNYSMYNIYSLSSKKITACLYMPNEVYCFVSDRAHIGQHDLLFTGK